MKGLLQPHNHVKILRPILLLVHAARLTTVAVSAMTSAVAQAVESAAICRNWSSSVSDAIAAQKFS